MNKVTLFPPVTAEQNNQPPITESAKRVLEEGNPDSVRKTEVINQNQIKDIPDASEKGNPRSRRWRFISLVIAGVLLLVVGVVLVVVFAIVPNVGSGSSNSGPIRFSGEMTIISGNEEPAADGQIGLSGGSIAVANANSPLNGATIVVPEGALSLTVNLKLSYSPITSELKSGAAFASSLIHITANGTSGGNVSTTFDKSVTVTLPITKDSKNTKFYKYDEAKRIVDPVFEVSQTNNSITFLTNTFSKFVAINHIVNVTTVSSSFSISDDIWPYNDITEKALGVVLYAKWYFTYRRTLASDVSLSQRYNRATSLKIAAKLHSASYFCWEPISSLVPTLTYNAENVFTSVIQALSLTGQPQALGLFSEDGLYSHTVLVHSYDGTQLRIYDPYRPNITNLGIPYSSSGGFESYLSYRKFWHIGLYTLVQASSYDTLYVQGEAPTETGSIILTDSTTTPIGSTPALNSTGYRYTIGNSATITGYITNYVTSSIVIKVNGNYYSATVSSSNIFSLVIPLEGGCNELIITASTSQYNVEAPMLTAQIYSQFQEADLTLTLTWDKGHSDVDLHVLEPDNISHIYFGNKGRNLTPYLDFDNTQGYGPEHYYLNKNMTFRTPSMYGIYKYRVNYYGSSNAGSIRYTVREKYISSVSSSGVIRWSQKSVTGVIYSSSGTGPGIFYNTASSCWSPVYTLDFKPPTTT